MFFIDVLKFFTGWEFVIFTVLFYLFYCVMKQTKKNLLTRILVYYPMLVFVTFMMASVIGLAVFMFVYAPIMWMCNGIRGIHAEYYWILVLFVTVFLLIKTAIKTETENKKHNHDHVHY